MGCDQSQETSDPSMAASEQRAAEEWDAQRMRQRGRAGSLTTAGSACDSLEARCTIADDPEMEGADSATFASGEESTAAFHLTAEGSLVSLPHCTAAEESDGDTNYPRSDNGSVVSVGSSSTTTNSSARTTVTTNTCRNQHQRPSITTLPPSPYCRWTSDPDRSASNTGEGSGGGSTAAASRSAWDSQWPSSSSPTTNRLTFSKHTTSMVSLARAPEANSNNSSAVVRYLTHDLLASRNEQDEEAGAHNHHQPSGIYGVIREEIDGGTGDLLITQDALALFEQQQQQCDESSGSTGERRRRRVPLRHPSPHGPVLPMPPDNTSQSENAAPATAPATMSEGGSDALRFSAQQAATANVTPQCNGLLTAPYPSWRRSRR